MIYQPWSGYDHWYCKACRFETLDAKEAKTKLLADCAVRAVFTPPSQPEEPDQEPTGLQPDSQDDKET